MFPFGDKCFMALVGVARIPSFFDAPYWKYIAGVNFGGFNLGLVSGVFILRFPNIYITETVVKRSLGKYVKSRQHWTYVVVHYTKEYNFHI